MRRLEEIIRAANSKGRIALVPFLTGGYPDKESFWKHIEELDANGADIIEIGVPFSDPVADGPVVEAASRGALENGVNIDWILEGLAERKGKFRAGLVLMGYYNPFLQADLEKLADKARDCGVSGFIVPDLPYEEAAIFRGILEKRGIALIPLIGPNTSEERMMLYAQNAAGYVYVVSVMGITGERNKIPRQIADKIALANRVFSVPVALGFGLKNPSQLDDLPVKPDAAVFGSALLKHLAAGKSAAEFLEVWTGGQN